LQKDGKITLRDKISTDNRHGRRKREAGGVPPPRIFIHGTDIVGRDLTELFFGLFSVGPPGNFSADTLDNRR